MGEPNSLALGFSRQIMRFNAESCSNDERTSILP